MDQVDPELINSVFEQAQNGLYDMMVELSEKHKDFLTPPFSFLMGYVSGVLSIDPKHLTQIFEVIRLKIMHKKVNLENSNHHDPVNNNFFIKNYH